MVEVVNMKGHHMKKLFICSLLFLSAHICGQPAQAEIQEKTLHIVKEAHVIFESAKNLFDKLLFSSYARDKLTFKDFVGGIRNLTNDVHNKIICPLRALRSTVQDQEMRQALQIVESVAVDLHQGTSALCASLNPYERTKKSGDAYKVAKIIKTHGQNFLNKARFDKFKQNDAQVIVFISRTTEYNNLTNQLKVLQTILGQVNFGASNIPETKVLRLIGARIKKN